MGLEVPGLGVETHPAHTEEQQRLTTTLAEVRGQLAELRRTTPPDLQELLEEESPDAVRVAEQTLAGMRLSRAWQMRLAQSEPHFGRIDFAERGSDRPVPLYIGKVGVENTANREPLVIDWRAPVASLFYNPIAGEEGAAEYEAPEGIISGTLHLKRNLAIKGGLLQRIVDSQVQSGDEDQIVDEFLQYRLWESRDARLRDIVSTIQAEQNEIIRAGLDQPLIIQGVAGSGKTTVALHRLAFLLYRYREQVAPARVWIFAPNRVFLDYISAVLPELGVGGVRQTTFSDWALEELEWEVSLTDTARRLAQMFDPGNRLADEDAAPGRRKGSLAMRDLLEQALAAYEANFVPDEDVQLWPGARIRVREIRQWFHEQYAGQPLYGRKARIIARVKVWMGQRLDPYRDRAQFKERQKQAQAAVRRWAAHWPDHTPLQVYRNILAGPLGQAALPAALVAETLALLKKGQVSPDDLAPLLWLKGRLLGFKDHPELDHVVIDEAQDFSPLQVALLRELARTDSFTILGDLSQGIHTGQGIASWAELQEVFPGECRYFTLAQSYRSTYEIVTFANAVISRVGAPTVLARPVFRSGAPVRVGLQVPGAVAAAVRALREQGHASVAVVGRTEDECCALQAELQAADLAATLITARQAHYRGGLSVIPSYLTKGLEFDAVVVAGAGPHNYTLTAADAKLLYVCLTRALHELVVLYPDVPSPLLQEIDPTLYVPPAAATPNG